MYFLAIRSYLNNNTLNCFPFLENSTLNKRSFPFILWGKKKKKYEIHQTKTHHQHQKHNQLSPSPLISNEKQFPVQLQPQPWKLKADELLCLTHQAKFRPGRLQQGSINILKIRALALTQHGQSPATGSCAGWRLKHPLFSSLSEMKRQRCLQSQLEGK